MKNWKRTLLKISPAEVTFSRRGFTSSNSAVCDYLESVGTTFVAGYHAALACDDITALAGILNSTPCEQRGFAFEGAAMGLSLQDCLLPWGSRRLDAFLNGPGADHTYMVHVGAGWTLARLKRRVERPLQRLDPLLRWLVLDGYGFHEGYFHPKRYVEGQALPERLNGYAQRVFDQGLGRSLWFVRGADADRIRTTIAAFAPHRQADLWSGVGLACAYAGGVDLASVEAVRCAAGPYLPHLAQGAAFGAQARRRAGNPTPHTDLACGLFCGMSAVAAAAVTDAALIGLAPESAVSVGQGSSITTSAPRNCTELPAYEVWRRRIQHRFTEEADRP